MQHRKLEISYLKIPASSYHKEITLNDKMLLDYYNKNKKRFMIPAKAKFAYLQLNYSDFIKKVKVTDNQLTKHFKQYKNTFREPTVRKASHILVKVAKNASAKKVAAAQKKINDAYNRLDALQKLRSPGDPPIKSGGVFKKLVKSHSDDKFVAGYVVDPVKQKALYTALNKVPVGLNSKPVRGKKGFYILLLTSSKPGKLQTFDAVKSTIRSKLLRIEALKLYSKKVDVLTTQVFENSETLDVAATTLKLEIKTTDWVQKKDKFKGVLALSQVRDEAFSKDVYASGSSDDSVNSRSIKINNGKPDARTIVIRLKEYQNSKLKTFEQVKPEVMKLVQAEVAASKAKQQGLSLLKQLKANSTLQALAKGKSWVVTKPEMIDRFNDKHPKPLVKKAFALGVPKKGGKYVNGVQLNNGDYIIFRLGKSEYGSMDKVNVQTRKIYSQGNAAMYSQVLLQNTLDLLRKEANVTLKPYLVLSNTNEN